MKKWLWIFVFFGVLFWSWVALRLTNTLNYYKISSRSNRPTLDSGTVVFGSNLQSPDHEQFICFKRVRERGPWIFRCIGMAGDVIEIKDLKVYRNGLLLNEPYIDNDYIITQRQLNPIRGYIERNKNLLTPVNDSTFKLTLSIKELKAYHLHLNKVIAAKGQVNDEIFDDFKKAGFNEDNFGPLKVPANCYFLMGDNRHDAFDSRYIGFVRKDQIIVTVLGY